MLQSDERRLLEDLRRTLTAAADSSAPFVPRTSQIFRRAGEGLRAVLNAEIALTVGELPAHEFRQLVWEARAALDLYEHCPTQLTRQSERQYPEADAILGRLVDRY